VNADVVSELEVQAVNVVSHILDCFHYQSGVRVRWGEGRQTVVDFTVPALQLINSDTMAGGNAVALIS
jgi:hypothetical protein